MNYSLSLGSYTARRIFLSQLVIFYNFTVQCTVHLVNFRPKSMLQFLLCSSQCLVLLKVIQVRKNTHDSWKSMHLTDIQKFENFHFEAKASINQEKDLETKCWKGCTYTYRWRYNWTDFIPWVNCVLWNHNLRDLPL